MKIRKFHVYLADLSPRIGTERGKVRPVAVIQTDLLNDTHLSTIICPLTTKVVTGARILRVHIPKKESNLDQDSDILVDQIRPIDNRRFRKHMSKLTAIRQERLLENLRVLILE